MASAHELEEKVTLLSVSPGEASATYPADLHLLGYLAAMVAYCIACNISHTMVGGATQAGAAPIVWAQ